MRNFTFSQLGVTNVVTIVEENEVIVTITLFKPGLLIGASGRTIDSFTGFLQKLCERDVKIIIDEPTFLDKESEE